MMQRSRQYFSTEGSFVPTDSSMELNHVIGSGISRFNMPEPVFSMKGRLHFGALERYYYQLFIISSDRNLLSLYFDLRR